MRVLLAALLLVVGCSKRAIELDDLACTSDDDCVRGWTCDPTGVCVAGASCVTTGSETCDGADNDCNGVTDDVDDIDGECDFIDSHVSTWQCLNGACAVLTCEDNYYDHESAGGCETYCVATGEETCNDVDDDCSGTIDDVEDLFNDCATQLGNSNNVASFTCIDGVCGMVCEPGWIDQEPGANGCETACTGPVVAWYHDADLDGFTNGTDVRQSCVDPDGTDLEWLDAATDNDCDDTHARTFPGAAETDSTTACMRDDDDDGYGDESATTPVAAGTDCDDTAADASPTGVEAGNCSDQLDNDCDGFTDADDVADCPLTEWWDDSWDYRVPITIDNTTRTEELTDFPLLVKLEEPPIDYNHVTSGFGQDIRFVDPIDQTVLDHQIERWDSSGTSYVWVKVTVPASANKLIYVYYGNMVSAPNHDVWSNGYVAVWHLRESTGGFVDSTGHGIDAFRVDWPERAQPGPIGRCVIFNRDDFAHTDSLRADHDARLHDLNEVTLEAWIAPLDLLEQEQRIVQKRIGTSRMVYGLTFPTRDGDPHPPIFEFRVTAENGDHDRAQSTALSMEGWSWVAAAYDFATKTGSLYVNGNDPIDFTFTVDAYWGAEEQIDIGGVEGRNERGFRGGIDEVRISNVRRTHAWMAAQYASMTGTMTSFGDEEAR